jgi:hypothetical protein
MGAAGETGTTAAANKTSKAGAPTAAATVTSAPPSTYSDWAAAFQVITSTTIHQGATNHPKSANRDCFWIERDGVKTHS